MSIVFSILPFVAKFAFAPLLAFVLDAVATVTPSTRQTSEFGCENFGADGFSTAARPFSLAAWNTTLPNANSTGAPLVVGSTGAFLGVSEKRIATFASFPFNDFAPLTLVENDVLIGQVPPEDQSDGIPQLPQPGDTIGWTVTTEDHAPPAHTFCGVNNGDSTAFPLLAAFGRTDKFSLCVIGGPGGQNVITWNAQDSGRQGCYAVNVHIIFEG